MAKMALCVNHHVYRMLPGFITRIYRQRGLGPKSETHRQKNFGLIYTIWLDTPAMQSSPHPAEQNKMFANDVKLKC
jgi:hypothetical protein